MKGTAFLFIILISGLLLAGRGVNAVSGSGAPGTPIKIRTAENRIVQPPLLANRIDTKDSVIYTTDPGMERAMREEKREEKDKEDKSWQMLQHMYIYKHAGKHSPPDNTPPQ